MLRKYVPVIHVHPILLIFIVIAFVTGTFIELFVIMGIVLFHELGHYMMAILFKWRIKSIMLWIFGGVMDTDEHGSRPFHEELLVTIAGPFQNVLLFVILQVISAYDLLPVSVMVLLIHYNTLILVFNLLPIWPLDGGKCLFLLLSMFMAYRLSYQSILVISVVACVILLLLQFFVLPFTLSSVLLILFLIKENSIDYRQRSYVFMRFLLKRYQGDTPVKGIQPIVVSPENRLLDVFARFRREKEHMVYVKFSQSERYAVTENECLQQFFYEKQHRKTIGEIALFAE